MRSHKNKIRCLGQQALFNRNNQWRIAALTFLLLIIFESMAAVDLESIQSEKQPKNNQWRIHFPQLTKVGEGKMTWFGLSIYHASLWSNTGQFESLASSLPLALHITYEKNISRDKLIETTLDEWRRLDITNKAQRDNWKTQLKHIWPNVKPGDSITTVVSKNGQTLFFSSERQLGVISDSDFGLALLSIWLHPDTSASDLRTKLIGNQGRQS